MNDNEYITFNAEDNALDSLEKAVCFIQEAKIDPYNYKWVIISLFNALYGFAVCAARGTSNIAISKTKKNGEEYLIDFDNIIKLCQNKDYMNMTVYSKPLILSNNHTEAVKILKDEFRNNFEHFTPKLWVIEVKKITQIIPDIFQIINFLALETGNYLLLNNIKRNYVKELLEKGYSNI